MTVASFGEAVCPPKTGWTCQVAWMIGHVSFAKSLLEFFLALYGKELCWEDCEVSRFLSI